MSGIRIHSASIARLPSCQISYQNANIFLVLICMIDAFKDRLKTKHYTTAFVEHLAAVIDSHETITTFQEIYELIYRQCDAIVRYFISNPDSMANRNSLCFDSLKEYFHLMIRKVHDKFGNDVSRFKEGLRHTVKEFVDILSGSPSRIVKNSESLLKGMRTIMVYSYSKSIALSLKKLHKNLDGYLEIYVCRSGALEEGIQMYQQLVMERLSCKLISESEAGYYMAQMDCVVVGAEAILENGSIVNRAGTYMLSLLAKAANKPFFVFAASYKFIKKTYLTQRDIPQIHLSHKDCITIDLTPASGITMFCMDSGLFSPEVAVCELVKVLS